MLELLAQADWLQVAVAVFGIGSSWFVSDNHPGIRFLAFVGFLLTNILALIWCAHHATWWFFAMYVCYVVTSLRGMFKSATQF